MTISSAMPRQHGRSVTMPTRRTICVAAMQCFAAHGSEAASLRLVAKAAGVSVGFLQHQFGNKGALIEAVDLELITIMTEAAPNEAPPPDPISDVSHRLQRLMADHPDAIDYFGRLLIDNHPTGQRIFDLLFGIGKSQCDSVFERGTLRTGFDSTWGALHALIHVLGTLILRSHIQRQLPESLVTPGQLRNWESAVDNMIRGA